MAGSHLNKIRVGPTTEGRKLIPEGKPTCRGNQNQTSTLVVWSKAQSTVAHTPPHASCPAMQILICAGQVKSDPRIQQQGGATQTLILLDNGGFTERESNRKREKLKGVPLKKMFSPCAWV